MDKIYITDDDDNMIVVKLWDGVEVHYYNNWSYSIIVVQSLIAKDHVTGSQVACFINLSYKAWLDDDGIPTCSTSDHSIITIKPQDAYLKPTFRSLQKFIKVTSSV